MQKCTKRTCKHVKSKMEEKCCSKEPKNTRLGKKKNNGGSREKQNPIKIPKVKTPQKQEQHEVVPGSHRDLPEFSSYISPGNSERVSRKQTYSPRIVCRSGPGLIHLTWIPASSKYIRKTQNSPGGVLQPKEATIFKLLLQPKLFYWFHLSTLFYRQENWIRKKLKAVFSSTHE